MAEDLAPTDDTGTPAEPAGSDLRGEPCPPPGGSDLPAGPPEHPGPDPGAGGQPDGPAGGVPVASPLWRRRRVQVLAGIVAVLLVALGVGVQRAVTGQGGSHAPRGTLLFPGTLLGLGQDVSKTRDVDRSLRRHRVPQAHGTARGLAGSVYGHLPGGFVVIGGRVCGSCAFRSFQDAMGGLQVSGLSTRTFDPGPKGGSLLCADHSALQAKTGTFACWWFDNTSGAVVIYSPGVASSLANAAELTRQVRAAVEQ
jgi:hypothetical protein